MLRSTLLCLVWLLSPSLSSAQTPSPSAPTKPAQAVTPPTQARAATTPVRRSDNSAAQPAAAETKKPEPTAGAASERKVRLHVTVDVVDPSRDVRDIISEL